MFPDSRPLMLSDLSLIIQTLVFLLILYAVYIKRKSISKHGKIAGVAFYLALPSVFYMLYSRSRTRGLAMPDYHSLMGIHMILGILSIFLGILFVANRWKWKGKKYMDLGALLWAVTFLLGFTFYTRIFGFP
jgi:uncharacterized membrane protein YozB (DUF420 family)